MKKIISYVLTLVLMMIPVSATSLFEQTKGVPTSSRSVVQTENTCRMHDPNTNDNANRETLELLSSESQPLQGSEKEYHEYDF